MADNQYIYAVARIRTKELSLLTKLDLDQLLACKSYKECMHLLADKGWGRTGEESADELLSVEHRKTWEVIGELVEDLTVFNTFLVSNDFHNLKAALKSIYIDQEVPSIYISHGTIAVDTIVQAVKEHDFNLLPDYMRDSAEEAYEVLFHTGDSQLSDCILDKAALLAMYQKGKESKNDLFLEYAELKVASADINIAIRGYKTKKRREFFERALAECESLNISSLMDAALEGLDAIYEYLSSTVYSSAVEAIKESPTGFERWCDNLIIEHIKPQKYNSFTISPLAAYILARENEIKSVRIILSGKLNDLSESAVRERLREMYV